MTNRLTRSAAVALAIAAAAAPAAVAKPTDAPSNWRALDDAPGAVSPRGIYEPMRPENQPQPPQNLSNPDTKDFVAGRGTFNSPEVVVLKEPAPAAQATADGIDWADAGIGAGSLMGLSLVALGGGLLIVHRRGARQLAS